MWALGVATFTLLYAASPFTVACGRPDCPGLQDWLDCPACDRLLHASIRRADVIFPAAPRVSAQARDFVRRLLAADPAARLTARQAARHPFLTRRPDPEWRCSRSLAVLRESYCVQAGVDAQLFPSVKQGSKAKSKHDVSSDSNSTNSNFLDTTFLNDSSSSCDHATAIQSVMCTSSAISHSTNFIEIMQTPAKKSLRDKLKTTDKLSVKDKLKIVRFAAAHGMSLPQNGIVLRRPRTARQTSGTAPGVLGRVKRRILARLAGRAH